MFEKFMDIERLIHSIKTVIACIIGFCVAQLIGYSGGLWILVTIIVVMCAQIYVGSVLLKAYMRFLGTLVGCLFAAITLLTAGPNALAIAITISISSFIFSYIATSNENLIYAGTLGAATTAIILLNPFPTLEIAAQRFFEISTGLLIATLTSQFILPLHARTHLRRNQANTLKKLRDYYTANIITHKLDVDTPIIEEDDEEIVKSLTKQRQLAKDAGHEPFGATFEPHAFVQSLSCEKQILRAIIFMHIALVKIEYPENILQSSAFKAFNDAVIQSFNVLIKTIGMADEVPNHIHVPALAAFKEDLQKKRSTQEPEDAIYVDGLIFAAEYLVNSLTKLANLNSIALK